MDYILIYFGVGLFFATSVWLQTRSKLQNKLIVSILILLLWPLAIIILSSEVIEDEGKDEAIEDDCKQEDYLKNKVGSFLSEQQVEITNYERKRIEQVAKYGYDEVYIFSDSADFQDIIDKLWNLHLHPKIYHSYLNSVRYLEEDYDPNLESDFKFSIRAPDWYVGFSNEFVKSISKIDRKKQGRILESIEKIASAPTEIKGNTIKPLTGDLNGLWRCRIGNDRLIYFPDIENKKIVLITFSARGKVYNNVPDVSSLIDQ